MLFNYLQEALKFTVLEHSATESLTVSSDPHIITWALSEPVLPADKAQASA